MTNGGREGGVEEFEEKGGGEPAFRREGGGRWRERESGRGGKFADGVEVDGGGEVEVAHEDGVAAALAKGGLLGTGGDFAELRREGGEAREERCGVAGVG
jgi:hypothetical protein